MTQMASLPVDELNKLIELEEFILNHRHDADMTINDVVEELDL